MSARLSMKFTAANSTVKQVPIMRLKTLAPINDNVPTPSVPKVNTGKAASDWRAKAFGGSFTLKKSCGCGG
jgi:hypothetical protein